MFNINIYINLLILDSTVYKQFNYRSVLYIVYKNYFINCARVFNHYPGGKAVYIAPLKALVRERIDDWKVRMEEKLGKKVVELTGDTSPDIRAIEKADVIVTTPEKWDGISRSWQNRSDPYIPRVDLLSV
jgi:replicative superfamily II helicase